jgi:hypothetical protein
MRWQTQVRAWIEKRGASAFVDDVVLFFEKALETPRTLYPSDAWFGIHDTYASLTIGNIWLASIGTAPHCAYLLAEPSLKLSGMKYLPIRSTFKYVPLVFLNAKPFSKLHALNENPRAWNSYTRACELILHSPISRNVITRNLRRKVRLDELFQTEFR